MDSDDDSVELDDIQLSSVVKPGKFGTNEARYFRWLSMEELIEALEYSWIQLQMYEQ